MLMSFIRQVRRKSWLGPALLGVTAMLAILLISVRLVSSYTEGAAPVACMNVTPCTANDVRIKNIYLTTLTTPACLDDGTGTLYADVLMRAEIQTGATDRYDIGLWVALEGGSANTGSSCYHGILTPLENPPTTSFLADGGPYRNTDGDYCGDTKQNDGLVYAYLQPLKIKCQDATGDGLVDDISTCTSWDNNANTTCANVAGAVPGTGSKCYCGTAPITPPIVVSQIIVKKATDPSPNPYGTSFGFTVSGTGLPTNPTSFSLQDGGTWASGLLPAGTYSVVENTPLPAGWTLANVSCTDGVNSYNPASITLPGNKTVVCTFTNRTRGSLTIIKNVNEKDGTDFGFTATGGLTPATFTLDDDGGTDGTYADRIVYSNIMPGNYSVTESAPPSPWTLVGIACQETTQNTAVNISTRTASIMVDPGESVVCTYYNADPTAVTLRDLEGSRDGDEITLSWETSSEVDTLGFNVYRSKKVDSQKTLVNPEIIAAVPGAVGGSTYRFVDTTAPLALVWYYWIEDVALDGTTTMHGPLSVSIK